MAKKSSTSGSPSASVRRGQKARLVEPRAYFEGRLGRRRALDTHPAAARLDQSLDRARQLADGGHLGRRVDYVPTAIGESGGAHQRVSGIRRRG